jgi:hypothetical protein
MKLDDNYIMKNNVFHVSELSNTCLLKMYLDRIDGRICDDQCEWALYRGRIFDQHITKLFDETQRSVTHRVPKTNYVIRGKIDGLNYEDNLIVELKTAQFMDYLKQPRDSHINQALFYLACFDPLATCNILYVSMGGYKNFEFTGTKSELNQVMKEFNRKAKLLGDSLKSETPPEGTPNKECDYCTHRELGNCPIKKKKQTRQKKKLKFKNKEE